MSLLIDDVTVNEEDGSVKCLTYELRYMGVNETNGYNLDYSVAVQDGRAIINSIELSEAESWLDKEQLIARFIMDDVRKILKKRCH